jgi:hypothetical protein
LELPPANRLDYAGAVSGFAQICPVAALSSGAVRLNGPRALTRAFPSWLMLSRFADVPRPGPG